MTIAIIVAVIVLWGIASSWSERRRAKSQGSPIRTTPRSVAPSVAPANAVPDKPLATSAAVAEIEVNEHFRAALTVIADRRESAFITGKAGTGKSTLLRCFREAAEGKVVVLAPTGLAAINVAGQTIHSFFKFPPRLIDATSLKPSRTPEVFRKVETIVIDEVSMVRADLLDGIDAALRINRRAPNTPFGGVQMVFFGDLFQLPPIVKELELKEFFATRYGSPYFFSAAALRTVKMSLLELQKVYRQTDTDFLDLLNRIRDNQLDEPTLQLLNSRVRHLKTSELRERVTLTATNQAAFGLNQELLNSLPGPETELGAAISGKIDVSSYPTEATLRVKPHARVMMIRNDPTKRWVNGTLAVVKSVAPRKLVVDIGGRCHDVRPETWENIEYYYDHEKQRIRHRVIGSFSQFPVRLAWAITIHKSQGQTFDHIHLDLGRGAFAHGQTYVALSRCRTLEGITLARALRVNDVIFDEAVRGYRDIFSLTPIAH